MLNTLKEIIQNTNQLSEEIIKIVKFLFDCAKHQDESLRNIVAECIGKICLINIQELSKHIETNLKSNDAFTRYTTASSFKYFCVKKLDCNPDLSELIRSLIEKISDEDLNVRAAVFKSINNAAYNIPKTLIETRKITNELFFSPMITSLRVNKALIKEVELGAFKLKIDEGFKVRNQAFSLLDTALDTLHYKGVEKFENEVIEEVLLGLEEEPSEDIKILRLQILNKLANKLPVKIVPNLVIVSDKLEKVLAPYEKKQEGDRAKDTIRAAL